MNIQRTLSIEHVLLTIEVWSTKGNVDFATILTKTFSVLSLMTASPPPTACGYFYGGTSGINGNCCTRSKRNTHTHPPAACEYFYGGTSGI